MNILIDQTTNVTITSIIRPASNETLLTEIPIERIDGSSHRFRFQVENYFFLN